MARERFFHAGNCGRVKAWKGVREIGKRAFEYCTELKAVELPDSLTEIGERAFRASSLQSVRIPAGVTEVRRLSKGTRLSPERKLNASLTLIVDRGSYAEKYAMENGFPWAYPDEELG